MNERLSTIAAFAAIYVIWGSTYFAIGEAVADVPPVFMVAVRGMLAGGALYLWSRRRGAPPITGREVVAMMPTAALLFGGGYVLVGWAEQHVASGPAALLNSTTPAWVVLFEWLKRRRARPDFRFVLALALGVVGVSLLVRGNGDNSLPAIPVLALVAASVAWAAGTLRTGMQANGDPMRNAAVQLLTGGLLLMPVSAGLGELGTIRDGMATSSLLALGYLVTAGSIVGYTSYVWLLHRVSASKVASHAYVNPLIAVIVGAVLAGERIDVTTVVAASLILISVYFIVKEKAMAVRPARRAPAAPKPRLAA